MERVKEEANNANEARYLHYMAYVVELETAKVMEELSDNAWGIRQAGYVHSQDRAHVRYKGQATE